MAKSRAKTWLDRFAEKVPLPVYQFFIRREAIGLLYHVVSDESLPHIRHLYPYKNVASFESDLAYLKDHYPLVSYEELLEQRAMRRRPALPAALLSFDDGFKECFSIIRPILLRNGIPAVFFVNTDGIDNRRMLYRQKVSLCIDKVLSGEVDWERAALAQIRRDYGLQGGDPESFVDWVKSLNYRERDLIDRLCQELEIDVDGYLRTYRPYLTSEEILALAGDGFTMGAHTRGHAKLNLLSPSEMEGEIAGSCRDIQQLTGQERVPFAFPFSAYGVDRQTLADILSRNPAIGLLFDAKGIRQERALLMNRIMLDKPLSGAGRKPTSDPALQQAVASDVPVHLHRAYADVFLLRVRGKGLP
jgi:peptidoglycan/xylan/chitin deacetylase (PgdA/CDA1 family)